MADWTIPGDRIVTKDFDADPPIMTTTQRDAINSPAFGLIIDNTTTNTKQFFNGTVWRDI